MKKAVGFPDLEGVSPSVFPALLEPTHPLSIRCPTCGAVPSSSCYRRNGFDPRPKRGSHRERVVEANRRKWKVFVDIDGDPIGAAMVGQDGVSICLFGDEISYLFQNTALSFLRNSGAMILQVEPGHNDR